MQTVCKTKEGNSRKGEYEEVVEETVTELFAIRGAFFKVFDDLPMKVHLIVLTV